MSDIDPMEASEKAASALPENQRENLSKALFPDTHTDTVSVLDIERTCRPLPIKWAKQLHAALSPVNQKIAKASESKKPVDLDIELLNASVKAAAIIAKFYDWEDISQALIEEEIELSEVQALLVCQSSLQKENDFLLTPLRNAVGVMRMAEVQQTQFQSMFSGPHSSKALDALSMLWSHPTPTPS